MIRLFFLYKYINQERKKNGKRPQSFCTHSKPNKTSKHQTENHERRNKILMLKILLLISLITGAVTAVVDYLKTDTTQQTIEQIKDKK